MTNKLPRHLGEGLKTNYNLKTKTEGRGEGRHWQKALQTATLSLALSFFIAAPVCAADTPPVPTLDRVKAENTTFINSAHSTYTLTELTADETAPEGSITVNIADKTYYYTPNAGDNTNTLQLLSATGNAALVETTQDDALYIADGKYYKYEAKKLPDSAYTLTETTVSDPENLPDNVITLYDKTEVIKYYDPTIGEEVAEADRQEGVEYKEVTTIETTPQYYTVELNKTEYGDSSGDETLTYGWEESADGELEFKLNPATPVGQQIFYKYSELSFNEIKTETKDLGTTTNPRGTEDSPTQIIGGAALNNPSGSSVSIDNILYKDNLTTANVTKTSGTSQTYADIQGGAVYNKGTISKITGAFINNELNVTSSLTGGAKHLYTFANGGAIANLGQIGDGTDGSVAIDADFIGNRVVSTGTGSYNSGYAQGGAIYNQGSSASISSITGDFIGNYASGSSRASGGAIYNYDDYGTAQIGSITGDFIGNYAFGSGSYTSADGGAIYNEDGTIGDITGDFIGNYASGSSGADGGAIFNRNSTIQSITGDFIGNYAAGKYANGGAIYNYGFYGTAQIGNITGDFIGNYASSFSANGGAIYNWAYGTNAVATIGDITGDFIGNYASSTGDYASGGAIFNEDGTIGDITGDFIGNYASSTGDYADGGAIYNTKTIGDITGDFIGNYASGQYAKGGAIYNNYGTIGSIAGDFIGNYASAFSTYANGGAINNYGSIASVTGDFIGNYASASSSRFYAYAYGGAIYNQAASISSITGDFIGNYAEVEYTGTSSTSNNRALGGAIYNYVSSSSGKATIGLTNNNFLNNYAKVTTAAGNAYAKGGAIFTNYDLTLNADNGTSLISGNYTETNGVKDQNAIYVANFADSSGTIQRYTTFTLNAVNNGKIQIDDKIAGGSYYHSLSSPKFWETSDHAYTLALTGDSTSTISLYNDIKNANVTSNNVTVNFSNGETRDYNFVSMTAGENTNLNLDVDFSNKTADTITTQNNSTGTLIINAINTLGTTDGAVTVQIIKNTDPSSSLQLAFGDNITEVAPDFVFDQNYVEHKDQFIQEGGLSIATTDTLNDSITIDIDKQLDTLQLINSYETNEDRTFQFSDSSNYKLTEDLTPTTSGVLNINGLGTTTPSTINAQNHTLFNLQNETTLNINNTTIENAKDYAIKAEHENAVVNLTNTSVKNTTTDTPDVNKAAIQSKVDLNITADAGKSEFSGNTAAIYLDNADKTVSMNSVNSGEIVLEDVVDGQAGYSVEFKGDNKSKITVNNNINNANISLDNTNLYVGREDVFNQSQTLSLNSGTMYLNNNVIGTMHVPTLNLNGNTDLYVDVDLANEQMDRVTADTYNVADDADAVLNVADLNLISTTEKENVKILFADEPLANNVAYSGDSTISYKGTNVIYSPIYKYTVNYGVDENDKQGYFFFNKATAGIGDGSGSDIGGGAAGNVSDSFNPSVLAPNVIQQAGAYTTQLQTFNYAFQHADTFMNIPYLERISMINANKYAMSPTADATDVGTFSPLLTKEEDAGFWVKPYASFENVPLKNGPKVSNINYGTLVGYDSPLQEISHGFERVLTGYIGYNGASQRYSGVDAYQNGGLIGGTATFYKGNFFNATTLSVGASAGDASTMYGSENYTMLLAGIGNKTGYNFEFFDGGLILQPNMLISYTFVNTFDYNNAAGVRIESDPLHAKTAGSHT